MKLNELLKSRPALAELAEKDINISIGYKIQKVIKEFNIVDKIYQDKINALYEEYGESKEDGSEELIIKKENIEAFNEKVNDIHNEDVLEDITDFQINLTDLVKYDISMKPSLLLAIDWIIREE